MELAAYGAPQGGLVVGARTAGEAFTSADLALLADLAPHVAAMAHSRCWSPNYAAPGPG